MFRESGLYAFKRNWLGLSSLTPAIGSMVG